MAEAVSIDFYLGIGSRYSYLAATQVDRIEREHGCRFIWKPIASGVLMDRRGNNPFRAASGSGQYDWRYREYDAKCWAAYYGVPFREPLPFKAEAALPALACLAAEPQGALVACCRLLQRMMFVEGMAVDEQVIADLPVQLGIDRQAFAAELTASHLQMRHEALLGEARARGVFGVPTFCLGRHLFWGNDRLVLLEATLKGRVMPFAP
jgi:2-hydroxychromene-2-carboxylate isomerase